MSSVTFLGTGTSQGVPMIGCDCEVCCSSDKRDNRLRTSVMLNIDGGSTIVIDAGMDFRYQMLREKVTDLDAILFTHEHKDHIGGLDDVRAFNYFLKKGIDVYAEERVVGVLKKDFDYAFALHRYPGVPELELHTITESTFTVKGIEIEPIRGYHYLLPVLGFKIGNFCYLTDMNRIDKDQIDKIKNIDTLVINALRREKHISHFNLSQALDVIERIAPKRAYLTHVSHQMGLYESVSSELPEGVLLAYDRLKIEL